MTDPLNPFPNLRERAEASAAPWPPELPEPDFPLSAAFLSISAMTESEYSASLESLMNVTTSWTSLSVMKQPCTRLGAFKVRGK